MKNLVGTTGAWIYYGICLKLPRIFLVIQKFDTNIKAITLLMYIIHILRERKISMCDELRKSMYKFLISGSTSRLASDGRWSRSFVRVDEVKRLIGIRVDPLENWEIRSVHTREERAHTPYACFLFSSLPSCHDLPLFLLSVRARLYTENASTFPSLSGGYISLCR